MKRLFEKHKSCKQDALLATPPKMDARRSPPQFFAAVVRLLSPLAHLFFVTEK